MNSNELNNIVTNGFGLNDNQAELVDEAFKYLSRLNKMAFQNKNEHKVINE